MSRKERKTTQFSTWTGAQMDAPAKLIPIEPPKRPEVNGAPIHEQSHEFVIKKNDAED